MGNSISQTTRMKSRYPLDKNDSPASVAFGRLRIDSPNYRFNSPTYRAHHPNIRSAFEVADVHGKDGGTKITNDQKLSIPLRRTSSLDGSSSREATIYTNSQTTERTLLLASAPINTVNKLASSQTTEGFTQHTHAGAIIFSSSTSSFILSEQNETPPLATWIGPALSCALAYALYNIFIKKGSASIHPVLGGVILQFVAAIVGSALCLFLNYRQGWEGSKSVKEDFFYDWKGIFFSVCAGLSVGAAEIISFMVSGMGVQSVQSIPIIIGGSVMFGTFLGWIILKEILTFRGWLGVAMIAGGISLVGMDQMQ